MNTLHQYRNELENYCEQLIPRQKKNIFEKSNKKTISMLLFMRIKNYSEKKNLKKSNGRQSNPR